MKAKLIQVMNRLELLSLRERVMVLAGVPLALLVSAEALWFGPARDHAAQALKEQEIKQTELTSLTAALANQPATPSLPAADQLVRQRKELQEQIDSGRQLLDNLGRSIDWGTVVRGTVAGTPGLMLVELKTTPAEPISMAPAPRQATTAPRAPVAGGRAAAPAGPAAQPPAGLPPTPEEGQVYRHRAELTVKGDFSPLLAYLQSLQRVPGELRWDRMELSVADYPQASVRLGLHTLSTRAETPFN
jgi:MSHA biogenesis protein MshJ